MKRTAGEAMLRRHAARFQGVVLLVAMLGLGCGSVFAAGLSLVVLKKDGRPLVGAVVTAEPEAGRAPPVAPQKATMDQVNLAFVPDVIVVPVGTAMSFPNS